MGVAVRVVAGMAIPALADRLDRRRMTLALCAAATLVLTLAHLGIERKSVLLLATALVGISMAGTGPLAEALGVAASRAWRFPYSPVRGIGSLGFLAANLGVGLLIARTGSGIALWCIVACMAALVVLSAGHPGERTVEGQVPPDLREIGRLVMNPVFALFMAVFAFIQASHAMMYSLGSIHWRDIGIGETEIGALWATAVGAEIVFLLLFGTYAIERLGPIRAMALSATAAIVRWSVMATDPVGFWLWPTQCLHALTFAHGAPRRHRLHQPRRPRPLLRRRPGRRRGHGGGGRHVAADGALGLALPDVRRTHLRPRHRLRRPRPRALPLARPPLAGRETGRLAR